MLAIVALLGAGCSGHKDSSEVASAPVRYENAEYGLTFLLPESWRGYSVLVEQWNGDKYSAAADKLVVVGHGPIITLRHPQWQANAPRQDIPILVFTRAQWDELHRGNLWPSLYAGGVMNELWHSQKYVFAMWSRYDLRELNGRQEVAEIVEKNRAVNKMERLYEE
ncbi:conserved hypothetical protein [Pedosphaera parvula Ellin514]|uniref:Uncharacterized protein n=2 Tax=Pedosphaera TaxID=1032526 RepID=B9XQE3_PEDPL|nr:conserved hypothetical protein [Pedosphaera parvula Ellin514]